MIDLHTHTIFSDGVLIPAELARRAQVAGLTAMAMTDHGDHSNLDFIIPRLVTVAQELNAAMPFTVIPGIELTHVPPSIIADAAAKARDLGAQIVVVHGETIVEPVCPGTNQAAIEACVDVLAHPGQITEAEAALAADKGVLLEITGRKGHSLTNGHVARMAKKVGARLVVNSDSHAPGDLMSPEWAEKVVLGAGLTREDFQAMQKEARAFLPNQTQETSASLRMLVVDDDAMSRMVLCRALGAHGECLTAANGREAIDAFRQALAENRPFDMITLDVMMPDVDGRSALAQIRFLEEDRDIEPENRTKIIMTTTLSERKDIEGAFRDQCDAYVTKPVRVDELLERVRQFGLID
ncbi:histidinol phosphate phosphatase domain-containing protein [Desulfatibacillum aliphaticivorans]|uniref:Protein with response regulator receiver domain n=1 Tax=Desulfatibacillum aliphaticivorans TaxID=218208 RepID=B8FB19_DESAL|nr:histidinol phosphate phosphatase domain-containing protein [Desulfatibacillum aliphaticivorans]ACL04105.1 Protein with response regulator receiver domain [Desulfatibacillum aliphaticivorans]